MDTIYLLQTVKVVLQEAVLNVNATNKSGLSALDVSDVILQMVGSGELTDYMLRDLLLRAGALRASELAGIIETAQVLLHHPTIAERAVPPPQILDLLQYLLQEISLLNPWKPWKTLAKEVKNSSLENQSALLVVAVLIATMTYQAVLTPPKESPGRRASAPAYLSHHLPEFIAFMVPNSIGFFSSLAVILLVMDEFPLKSLMEISVRCLAASYVSMLFLIAPTGSEATRLLLAVIGIIVVVDFVRFGAWLVKRWSNEIKKRSISRI
jgi:hypothetical protein